MCNDVLQTDTPTKCINGQHSLEYGESKADLTRVLVHDMQSALLHETILRALEMHRVRLSRDTNLLEASDVKIGRGPHEVGGMSDRRRVVPGGSYHPSLPYSFHYDSTVSEFEHESTPKMSCL